MHLTYMGHKYEILFTRKHGITTSILIAFVSQAVVIIVICITSTFDFAEHGGNITVLYQISHERFGRYDNSFIS